ncbi:MAG TPA: RNA polymerase sigma factor [Bryobacteraceae bacterium]|nr:RNA polymerase sigma factor [Bryobacteraceae bacterium]
MTEAEADQELFLRIHSGDEQAFVSLYRKRQGSIFRFALHMTGSETAAEDVTQDVFLAIMRDTGYDPSRGTISAYLFGIARKLVLRHVERGRSDALLESELVQGVLPELAASENPLAELTHRERIEALQRAVTALPRRYREVVVLCDLEELDYADAAAVLRCPIGTVRSRLHRARELLFAKLNQERQRPPAAMKPARCAT